MLKSNIKKLIISFFITFAIGYIPSIFINSSTDMLITPSFMPPDYIFPIVWSSLYTLLAIACYIIYKQSGKIDKLYLATLIVNSLWTVIFFGLKLRLLAFFWILLLLMIALYLFFRFYDIKKTAGAFLVPYIVWIAFAAVLNYSLYLLNK